MDDVNDTLTTNEAPAEPAEAAAPPPEPPPEIEVEFEDDRGDELAALEKKLGEEHDRLLRTAAELDNVRKRAKRDIEEAAIRARAEIVAELLPTIDALDLALKNADEATPAKAVIDGVEMVRRQFLGSMARFGLTPIACIGAPFDPSFHEAVAQIPHADVPTGAVIEDLRRGYLLGTRLLRASLVIVSSGAPAPATDEETADPEPGAATGEGSANG